MLIQVGDKQWVNVDNVCMVWAEHGKTAISFVGQAEITTVDIPLEDFVHRVREDEATRRLPGKVETVELTEGQ